MAIHIRRQAVIAALGSAATCQKGGSYAKSLRHPLDAGFPCYAVVVSSPVGERGRTAQSITNGAYLRQYFESQPAHYPACCHQPVRNWLRRILPWRLSRVSTVRHTEGRM